MFRKLIADKKTLGEEFNTAMERIDNMLDSMKGDHNQLADVD